MGFGAWLRKKIIGIDLSEIAAPRPKTVEQRVTALEMQMAEVAAGHRLWNTKLMPKLDKLEDIRHEKEDSAADDEMAAVMAEVAGLISSGTALDQALIGKLAVKYPKAAKRLMSGKL